MRGHPLKFLGVRRVLSFLINAESIVTMEPLKKGHILAVDHIAIWQVLLVSENYNLTNIYSGCFHIYIKQDVILVTDKKLYLQLSMHLPGVVWTRFSICTLM